MHDISGDTLFTYGFFVLAGVVIWYLIIGYATRAGRQVKNQRAIIDLLQKLCEKNGVTKAELDKINEQRELD